ncbi:DNA-cytosine methyltransferase, partial [mine drainage metagenome]
MFSGCGGLALGLARAGFEHGMMVEWNQDAYETVIHNRQRGIRHVRDWPIEKLDVRSIDWRLYANGLSLCAGGPPCQPFSVGGKHRGNDDARDMWPEAIRAVRETTPRAFMFENVRGLTRRKFADYLAWIVAHLGHPDLARMADEDHVEHLARLRAADDPPLYDVIVVKVNAADYGAPQKRDRVIIAGLRRDLGVKLSPLTPTHSHERLLWDQWVTGDYWRRHGLDMPGDEAVEKRFRAAIGRLRAPGATKPAGRPWVTVRDALQGLDEPNGHNNHVFQDGARAYPGHTGS